ncbi:DUF2779 domain-containing protein [candidate division WWE3 bacterium]|nr:DUF2779 domain-containing protein [candidate division WWE3 bacterium]
MTQKITLSKSDYMHFLRHPAWLWLRKFKKHKLPPIDENLQARFDARHEFELYAEKLYPEAIKLGFDNYEEYRYLPEETLLALEQGAETILQGRFEADGLTCIVDILDRVDKDTFDLIEIKSSTKVKPAHEYDLAFQTIVLEKAGINVRNISIIHVNNKYVKNGKIDPEKITTEVDVTESVRDLLDLTKEQISKAREVLERKEMPDLSPRYANKLGISRTRWFHEWLDVYKHLNPDLDPYSIYYLSYPNEEQIAELEDSRIEFIKDVPEELALRDKQKFQIICTRDDKRIIDKEKIQEFLSTFEYPLYFFDYETMSSVIPKFDGFQPYKDYPFQYSLHMQKTPNSEITHEEYLHIEPTNPMPGLLEKLKKDIGNKGSIITWNMSYEKSCNKCMAEFYPEYKKFLDSVNERIVDLMIPFSKMWFVDKDFYGSASIKKVQPVLVPDKSYKEMDVSDGLKARRMWTETILEGKNEEQREKIINDLSEYCTLDTLAMVEIFKFFVVNII